MGIGWAYYQLNPGKPANLSDPIYDLLGRPQYQAAVSGQAISTSIDLSTWPKGFYLLELRARNDARKMEQFLLK